MNLEKIAETLEEGREGIHLFFRRAGILFAVIATAGTFYSRPAWWAGSMVFLLFYAAANFFLCHRAVAARPGEIFGNLLFCGVLTLLGTVYSQVFYFLLMARVLLSTGVERAKRGAVTVAITYCVLNLIGGKTFDLQLILDIACNLAGMAVLTAGALYWAEMNRQEDGPDDLDELQKQSDINYHMAFTDGLTGLFNYRAYKEKVQNVPQYVLLVIDIDFFKRLNDTYGHATGNKVLATLARIIKANVRQGDLTFRYGGEEFLVVLPGTSQQVGMQIAERLRTQIAAYSFYADTKQFSLTVSIGVSVKRPNVVNQIAFEQADKALYTAKSSGRNNVQLFPQKVTVG